MLTQQLNATGLGKGAVVCVVLVWFGQQREKVESFYIDCGCDCGGMVRPQF